MYRNDGTVEHENHQSLPWSSGYNRAKTWTPRFGKRQQKYDRGKKRTQISPTLNSTPCYSDDSDEESAVPTDLLTQGSYIDASVAAAEKEGLFGRTVALGKKKKKYFKNDSEKPQKSRDRNEGPPPKKLETQRLPCRFYMEGNCFKGGLCEFSHDVAKTKKMEVCRFHNKPMGCVREDCQYMHQDFPCKFYHTGGRCFSADKCKFSHDPLTEETRRALEMILSAKSIIDVTNVDGNHEPKPREILPKLSQPGSPTQTRSEVKIIPGLLETEEVPKAQSLMLSPKAARPSGFYSEANVSPMFKSESDNTLESSSVRTGGQMNHFEQSDQLGTRGSELEMPGSMTRCASDINRPALHGHMVPETNNVCHDNRQQEISKSGSSRCQTVNNTCTSNKPNVVSWMESSYNNVDCVRIQKNTEHVDDILVVNIQTKTEGETKQQQHLVHVAKTPQIHCSSQGTKSSDNCDGQLQMQIKNELVWTGSEDTDISSCTDGQDEKRNKMTSRLTDVQSLNQNAPSGFSSVPGPAAASTFNIMQMINAMKQQSSVAASSSKPVLGRSTRSSSMLQGSQHQLATVSSTASSKMDVATPACQTYSQRSNTFLRHPVPACQIYSQRSDTFLRHSAPVQDPPVVNAVPVKPLEYNVVEISLRMPELYSQLSNIDASDATFRDDPRVRRHLSYLDKK